jgi:hypothetical protein
VIAHDLCRLASCRELSLARIEMQDAFLQIVVVEVERLPQFAKAAARIEAE